MAAKKAAVSQHRPWFRLREFVRLVNTPGAHLLIGLTLFLHGLVAMAVWHLDLGRSIVEVSLGTVITLIRGGSGGPADSPAPLVTCPKCGHHFDVREGA